ncbi:MAG: D-alanyl-D-alanine carboxypeptidase family protein [Lachnospiraceae bacterium]|nr:D-alanyl-D-alanine carboxypeptidase family protein [Lachnospiraceae bacterium]
MNRFTSFFKKTLAAAVSAVMLMGSAVLPLQAAAAWPTGPETASESVILMDADTNAVLYSKDPDRAMYPASVTKIMTTLLALEKGNLADNVTMTQTGVAYAVGGSSNLYTQVGEIFTLEQLLYGTMLKSANDMATQVGEYIGGTVEDFVAMMNARAEELGCTGTHFNNACGMPDPDHVTTVHDMALICQAALKNEAFRTIAGTHSYTIPATNMTADPRSFDNHNPLLVNPDYAYPGIIGGKTGYTDDALNTLATMVSQNGITLIAVTFRAADGGTAATDHRKLYDYGFNCFEHLELPEREFYTEGGYVTVPKGAAVADLTGEAFTDDNGNMTTAYAYADHKVGTTYMSAEDAKAKAEYEAAQAEQGMTTTQHKTNATFNPELKVEKHTNPLLIVLGILGGLIVLFIIFLIVMAALRANQRKKRRRRRQLKRQQQRERERQNRR